MYSVCVFVENIYKMGFLEGSGVPVLYIGRTVPVNRTTRTPVFVTHLTGALYVHRL
jgi:hypothetical protein